MTPRTPGPERAVSRDAERVVPAAGCKSDALASQRSHALGRELSLAVAVAERGRHRASPRVAIARPAREQSAVFAHGQRVLPAPGDEDAAEAMRPS